MWRIEFVSAKFLPILPEECQTNPGAYGFELALWLAEALANRGIITSYPIGEDWGWLIEFTATDGVEFTIGCSSLSKYEEGYSGQPINWSIFIKPYTSLKERFKGVNHKSAVEQLGQSIIEALQSVQIRAEHAES
jgi:hypothetical protein